MSNPTKNEGEGSRTGARKYDEGATRHAEKGASAAKAKKAARDLEDPEKRRELQKAEEVGRKRAKEKDPLLRKPGRSKGS